MADKSPEPRKGNQALHAETRNWEDQIAWTRTDRGGSWHATSVWPSSDYGVLHFVKDIKNWEWEPVPNFESSGSFDAKKNDMTRHHTKMAVDFAMSKLSEDSKTKTSTYSLHGFPPIQLTAITGTFTTAMVGLGIEPTFGGPKDLRSREDSIDININNLSKQFSSTPGMKATNLPEGEFPMKLRYNAVRGKFEIYGYSPAELVMPGGEYNKDRFRRGILFESSTLKPGINDFTPVHSDLSTYTLQLACEDYKHKIKEYLIPAGITAREIDIYLLDKGAYTSEFDKCSGNNDDSWNSIIKKKTEETEDVKTAMDKGFSDWSTAKELLKFEGQEVTNWYWFDLEQDAKAKVELNQTANDEQTKLIAQSKSSMKNATEHRDTCNDRNKHKDDSTCHDNCGKYCDEITRLTGVIDDAEAEKVRLETEMKSLKGEAMLAANNKDLWSDRGANEEKSRKEYTEHFLNWFQLSKNLDIATRIKAALNAADAYTKDRVGCKEA